MHLAYLLIFIQANWTGPSLSVLPKASVVNQLFRCMPAYSCKQELSEENRKKLLKTLDRDGETAYIKMLVPQYLLYARVCLVDNTFELDKLRVCTPHP